MKKVPGQKIIMMTSTFMWICIFLAEIRLEVLTHLDRMILAWFLLLFPVVVIGVLWKIRVDWDRRGKTLKRTRT